MADRLQYAVCQSRSRSMVRCRAPGPGRLGWAGFSLVALMAVVGCRDGGESTIRSATLKGRVLMDGQPVAEANVVFVPLDVETSGRGLPISYGTTDDDGRFELAFADGTPGVKAGWHRVLISKLEPHDRQTASSGPMNAARQPEPIIDSLPIRSDSLLPTLLDHSGEQIPAYYNRESDLQFLVQADTAGQQAVFELSSIDPLLR